MTECLDTAMQDRLPLLAQQALASDEAARVRAHVASCAACAAELRVIESARAVLAAATPRVDAARIAAAMSRPPARVLRLEPPRRAARALPRYALAAAASLLLVAALSVGAIRELFDGGASATPVDPAPVGAAAVPVAMLGASDLDELASDELEVLLAELETLEATIVAEPATIRQPITATPEGI